MLTQSDLKRILDYDPVTGAFAWAAGVKSKKVKCGHPAGHIGHKGYQFIKVAGVRYPAHRLAWLYCYGEWPRPETDHINGDPADNRIANLRIATTRENQGNQKKRSDNRSGYKGVYWASDKCRWLARIKDRGRTRYLGAFDTPEEAHAAYVAASAKVFGEYARPE